LVQAIAIDEDDMVNPIYCNTVEKFGSPNNVTTQGIEGAPLGTAHRAGIP
jgi:hypothetical protein